MSSFQKGITKSLKVATAAFGAVLSARTIKSFLETAARTETLGVAMESVARSSGYATSALNEHKKAVMDMGIAEQESMQILTRFMQAQLDTADASRLARVAQDAAVIANVNSSEAAEQMTEAIAKQRPQLLSQFGMTRNLNDIFRTYGDTVGKTTNQLTEAEKKQAMLNYVLSEGEKITGTYEASMGTAGKQIGSLSRHWQTFQNTVATPFLPALAKAVEGVTNALKNATAWMEANIATLQRWGQTVADVIGLFVKTPTVTRTQTSAQIRPMQAQTKAVNEQSDAIAGQGNAIEKAGKQAQGALASFDEINMLTSSSSGTGGGGGGGGASPIDGDSGIGIPTMAVETSEVTKEVVSSIDKIKDAIKPVTDALKRLWEKGLKPIKDFTFDSLKSFYNDFLKPVGKWVLGEGLPRLLDVLTNLLKDINWSKLTDAFQNFYKALAPFAINVGKGLILFIEELGKLLKPVLSVIVDGLALALDGLAMVINAIPEDVALALGGAIGGIVTAILMFKGATAVAGIVSGIGTSMGGMIGAIAAHPWLAIAAGIAAVAGAVMAFQKWKFDKSDVGQYVKELDKLVQSSENLNSEIDDMLKSHSRRKDDIKAEYGAVSILADEYFKLADKQSLTNDEQALMEIYAKELIDKIPELSSLIDEQTGAYRGTKGEIEGLIKKTKEYYMVQAAQESLTEIAKKQFEVDRMQKELAEERVTVEELLEVARRKHSKAVDEYNKAVTDAGTSTYVSNAEVQKYGREIKELEIRNKDLSASLDENAKAQKDLNGEWNFATGYIQNYSNVTASEMSKIEREVRDTKNFLAKEDMKVSISSNVDSIVGDINNRVGGIKLPKKMINLGWKVDKAPNFTIRSSDGNIKIQKYATGGFPDMGEMFIARESGPEMVGRIGSSTAVANNDQIVSAVSSGVYSAVVSAMGMGRSSGDSRELVLNLDGREVARGLIDSLDAERGRRGNNMILQMT